MSSEIVPALDGIVPASSASEIVHALDGIVPASSAADHALETTSAGISETSSDGLCWKQPLGDIRAFDLLGLRADGLSGVRIDLIGGNHHIRHFVAPEKGHQYVTHTKPTQAAVKHTLKEMKEPSTMLLRGCDQLLLQSDFPFERFKTLTTLEISAVSTTLPIKAISEMTQLQSLNLSHLLIQTLPKGFFSDLRQLRLVILRGCSKLRSLPSTEPLELLEVLDLSHCTALQELEAIEVCHPKLKMLDLSCTALPRMPDIGTRFELRVFFRDAKVLDLTGGSYPTLLFVKLLDLSGARNMHDFDQLGVNDNLVALDISRTRCGCIDFISDMVQLRYLILKECTRLVKLPAMGKLENLQVLDLSGCENLGDLPEDLSNLESLKELNLSGCSRLEELREGVFDKMSFLEKLDLSNTNIHHLPSFANLTNLQTLNISHTRVEQVPDFCLINLREFFCADCPKLKGVPTGLQTVEAVDLAPPGSGETDSKPSEFHLVSTFFNKSGFDQFKQKIGEVVDFISKIQENLNLNTVDTTRAPTNITTTNSDSSATNVVSCDISSQTSSRLSRSMIVDLKYIRDNIDILESSRNSTTAVDLLNDLMNASDNNLSISELRRTVVKLKVLVPPPKQVDALEEKNEESNKKKEKKKKKKKLTKRRMVKEEDVTNSDNDIDMSKPEMQNLSCSYESLTDTQRNCLLYFAVFPRTATYSWIKERILIQLWYAEGFIDPQNEENFALSNASSTENLQSNPNDAKRVESPNTIKEIGRKTLMVLEEKRFIQRYGRGNFSLEPFVMNMEDHVHSFVKARAKTERLFGFNDKNSKLSTPHFCLLKSEDSYPSSCKLWPNYTKSSEKVESFKTVRTLLNFNERFVDIKAEWFSKMRNLCVLHLGRSDFNNKEEPIEVVDLNFLEELKNMKQLRLLSLEGFSTITKLPKSVCKATNLKILNLRECSYLEELPDDIGSLKNLTHLDLTDCHILSKLPKGLRFLSKLEVLRGFAITYQIGGRQHRNACTLRELLKLEKLRKLTIVVNTDKFPNSEDLLVFKEMKNLCNLKITWENNYNNDQASQVVVGQEASRNSRWKQLKCWEQQTRRHETEEPSTSNPFDNLRKLVMYCFPLETAPSWLHPSGLQKLEKLYIVGGKLTTLAGDTNQMYTWNVKNLRLRYLPNLHMDWEELRRVFSNMTHCHKYDSDIQNFPGWSEWNENDDVYSAGPAGIGVVPYD